MERSPPACPMGRVTALLASVLIVLVAGVGSGRAQETTLTGFTYPRPTGVYPVGTRYLLLEDSSRLDGYSEVPDDFRWISVKVWYPADPSPGAVPEPFGTESFAEQNVDAGFLAPSYLSEVLGQPSASYRDAPMARHGAPWPILLYSSSGVMTANVFLAEELASHGYVVMAVGHPYWCEFYFDDLGTVFPGDKSNRFYIDMWAEENSDEVQSMKQRITRSGDVREKRALYRRLNELMPTEVADLALWQGDMEFLMDKLAESDAGNAVFRGRVDTQRVGVLGYSKGGALAGQMSATSNRIRAAVNLGGFYFGGVVDHDPATPFMALEHVEPWCARCPPLSSPFLEADAGDVYVIQLDGGTHATFTDLPLLADYVVPDGLLGSLPGEVSHEIIRSYVLAFFDTYVKGGPRSALLDQTPSPFAAARFTAGVTGRASGGE